ncbi:MAG TPA: hypothetical protein VFI06_02020 [Chitinophagaceae bacterium]|nr:hypothetical protein [Chitinophagaceae bacterium]
MARLCLILAFLCPVICGGQSHSFTVDDLVSVSSLSPQSFDDYVVKRGFPVKRRSITDNTMGFTFYENRKPGPSDSIWINRTINIYKKDDVWCIVLNTSSADEFKNGRSRLKGMNLISDSGGEDTCLKTPLLFQKRAITIEARCEMEDGEPVYSFVIKKKEIPNPGSIRYADDLLKFDSHEYLVACFGEKNVKKDVYIFSENESKKCSVLFPNSDEQAVFIWDDENNYRKISYVLISGTITTRDGKQYTGSFSHNNWELKNGIYQGMRISDLLRLNSNDFTFYGNQSEYSMMVEPKVTGSINFKWIGIGLNCFNCERSSLMNKQKVSASDAVNNNLAMHVSCIMISP